jgi:hypothetical protein
MVDGAGAFLGAQPCFVSLSRTRHKKVSPYTGSMHIMGNGGDLHPWGSLELGTDESGLRKTPPACVEAGCASPLAVGL